PSRCVSFIAPAPAQTYTLSLHDALPISAEQNGALVVFPGNVYGLGADFSKPLNEECTRDAVTPKGQLRNQVEARLERAARRGARSEEHTSELQSRENLVCRLLLEKKKTA